MLTHSSKKPFACPLPSCIRSYCDARSLRRHIDNFHARPTMATPGLAMEAAMAMHEGSASARQLPLNTMSSVSDDNESQQLAHFQEYEYDIAAF